MALGRCSKSVVPTASLRMTQLSCPAPYTERFHPLSIWIKGFYALWFVSHPVIRGPSKCLTFHKLQYKVMALENFCFKQSQTPDRSNPRRDPSNENIISIGNLRDSESCSYFGDICLFSFKWGGLKLISFRQKLNLNIIKHVILKHSFFLFKFL